jgi:hypothetical protein
MPANTKPVSNISNPPERTAMIFTSFNLMIRAAGDAKRHLTITVYRGELDNEFNPVGESEFWIKDDDQTDADFNRAVSLHMAEILEDGHRFTISQAESMDEVVVRDSARLDAMMGLTPEFKARVEQEF